MNSQTLLEQLRKGTHNQHQTVHELPLMRRLLSKQCSVEDYSCVLSAFYRFHLKYVTTFHHLAKSERFAYEAPAIEWLKHDLNRLSVSPLQLHHNVRQLNGSLEGYLGFMYVTQGSTLGGQVIVERLQRQFHEGQIAGATDFYYGFGPQTGQHWQAFINYLALMEAKVDNEKVVQAAQQCFQEITEELSHDKSDG